MYSCIHNSTVTKLTFRAFSSVWHPVSACQFWTFTTLDEDWTLVVRTLTLSFYFRKSAGLVITQLDLNEGNCAWGDTTIAQVGVSSCHSPSYQGLYGFILASWNQLNCSACFCALVWFSLYTAFILHRLILLLLVVAPHLLLSPLQSCLLRFCGSPLHLRFEMIVPIFSSFLRVFCCRIVSVLLRT